MNKTILVIELSLSGHRGEYVRWIVQALLDDGHRVIVMLPHASLAHESIAQLQSSLLIIKGFEIEENGILNKIIGKFDLLGSDFRHYSIFKKLYRTARCDVRVDYVFIPFIDHILYSIAVFGSPFGNTRYSGISMRPDFHYRKMAVPVPYKRGLWLKEYLFDRFLDVNTLGHIYTLDEALFLYYRDFKQKNYKLQFLPEPVAVMNPGVASKKKIMTSFSLYNENKYILVYGSLTLRKGINSLLGAIVLLGDTIDCKVILAGKADVDVVALLDIPIYRQLINTGKLIFINRYLSSEEEAVLFSTAYLCWLGYFGHYRASGVLIQAAKNWIPVVASNDGIIGWQVKKYGIGKSVDSQSVSEVSAAIQLLLHDMDYYLECKENTKKAFMENTLDNAMKTMKLSVM